MKAQSLAAVTLIIAFCTGSQSFGAGAAYFTASPASTGAGILRQGARGDALDLECDVSMALLCTWDVSAWYENDDGGAFGWSLDVGVLDPSVVGKIQVSNLEIPISNLTSVSTVIGVNQPSGALIRGASGVNLSGPGPDLWNILNFRMSKFKSPGDNQVTDIFAGIGYIEFGGNDPDGQNAYEVIQIGPNNPGVGYYYGSWPLGALPLPVITVTNTPEPAALGLIGVGTLLLTSRRRLRRSR